LNTFSALLEQTSRVVLDSVQDVFQSLFGIFIVCQCRRTT